MTKERLKSPRLRLFVALELPQAARQALEEWQAQLRSDELRAVPAQALHVTLAFLGHRYERELARIEAALDVPLPQSVPIEFEPEVRPLPQRRPRLYAAAVRPAEALMDLRAAIAESLAAHAGFVDDKRMFWPHVTLCRVKSSVRRHEAITGLPPLSGRFEAEAVTLFKSELLPQGASYTRLATRPL